MRFQPGLHLRELTDPGHPATWQVMDHQEHVDVGIGPGPVAADRPEHGETHEAATVHFPAGAGKLREKV
jgi:hypothetical protein